MRLLVLFKCIHLRIYSVYAIIAVRVESFVNVQNAVSSCVDTEAQSFVPFMLIL